MTSDLEIPDLPAADMLEIFASGGNGSEYVDAHWLLNKAATELREAAVRIEELEKALENSAKGWAGLLALGFIPERHRPTAVGLREEAFAAISARAYKELTQ